MTQSLLRRPRQLVAVISVRLQERGGTDSAAKKSELRWQACCACPGDHRAHAGVNSLGIRDKIENLVPRSKSHAGPSLTRQRIAAVPRRHCVPKRQTLSSCLPPTIPQRDPGLGCIVICFEEACARWRRCGAVLAVGGLIRQDSGAKQNEIGPRR